MPDPHQRLEPAAHERIAAGASAQTADEFFHRDKTPLERLHGLLHRYELGASGIVLLLAFVAFALLVGSKFTDPGNLSIVTQQVMVVGTLAIAQSLVILTAGIDLSVAAIMGFSSIVMGKVAIDAGLPGWVALLVGVAVGTACGAFNGLLVSRFKLPPFIATLGTLSIFLSLKTYLSDSQTIRAQDVEKEAEILQWLGKGFDVGGFRVNVGVLTMLGLFVVMWFALNWTAWGRHVYAVGNDPAAARLVGIRTDRVLMSVYVVAGLICGIAAWVLIGRTGAIGPQNGIGLELDSITAAVIGGISLFGGRGSVFGALIGAVIVGVFRNGLALYGLDALWQEFAIGFLILVAVAVDNWIRRARA